MLKALTAVLLTAAWIAYIAVSVHAVWRVLTHDPALFPKEYTLATVSAWIAGGIALWLTTEWARQKYWR